MLTMKKMAYIYIYKYSWWFCFHLNFYDLIILFKYYYPKSVKAFNMREITVVYLYKEG